MSTPLDRRALEYLVGARTVDDLARRLGVHRSTLYRIWAGKKRPGPKLALGLLRAGVPDEEIRRLLGGAKSA